MKRQRGQSAVEFALILPMFTLFLFGLIYGGTMFLQFFNLSNDARAEARRIAIMDKTARHTALDVTKTEGTETTKVYPTTASEATPVKNSERFGSFYEVTRRVWIENNTDVVVRTDFVRDNKDLPKILNTVNWPPKTFAMEYRMQLENE